MGNSFSPRESESEIISSNRQSDLKYLEREKTLLELKAKKRKAVFFICGMFYAIFGLVFFFCNY